MAFGPLSSEARLFARGPRGLTGLPAGALHGGTCLSPSAAEGLIGSDFGLADVAHRDGDAAVPGLADGGGPPDAYRCGLGSEAGAQTMSAYRVGARRASSPSGHGG